MGKVKKALRCGTVYLVTGGIVAGFVAQVAAAAAMVVVVLGAAVHVF